MAIVCKLVTKNCLMVKMFKWLTLIESAFYQLRSSVVFVEWQKTIVTFICGDSIVIW